MQNIRNFSIIAHIDHGKSTLADRIIQLCGGLSEREMEAQVLDSMDLERERGITIKAQTAALSYKARNGQTYQLNLIDTPGHVDFSYEVSRSLSACEGALLVVDASQGVEAQTVANCYTAIELGVEVVAVLNKMDLPQSDPERVIVEIEDIIGIPAKDAVKVSAKSGEGVADVLEAMIERVPAPKGNPTGPLKALIIDSWFDNYVGVVMLVRVVDGELKPKDRLLLMAAKATYTCEQVGVFTPKSRARERLCAGEVGFIIAGIKVLNAAKVGDTITLADNPATEALPGFKEIQPQVFAGLYPVESNEYEGLRDALEKLHLNDSSLRYEPESSTALGFGFRCGFLGLLHMDIVQERLEREYGVSLSTTAPTVVYQVLLANGTVIERSEQLPTIIGVIRPGTEANLEVWRDGAARKLSVRVAELQAEPVVAANDEPTPERSPDRLGLVVRELTAEERSQGFGPPRNRQRDPEVAVPEGLLVERATGPAADAGLARGDIVVSINGSPVKTVKEFRERVSRSGKTVALLINRGGNTQFVAVRTDN